MLQSQACKRGLLGPLTIFLVYFLSNPHPLLHLLQIPNSWLAIPNVLIPLHILSDTKPQSHLSHPESKHTLSPYPSCFLVTGSLLFCLNSLPTPELIFAVSFAQLVPVLSSSPHSLSEAPLQIASPQTTPFPSFSALQSQEQFLDKQLQVSVTRPYRDLYSFFPTTFDTLNRLVSSQTTASLLSFLIVGRV